MELVLGLVIGASVGVIALVIVKKDKDDRIKGLESVVQEVNKRSAERVAELEAIISSKDVQIHGLELSLHSSRKSY